MGKIKSISPPTTCSSRTNVPSFLPKTQVLLLWIWPKLHGGAGATWNPKPRWPMKSYRKRMQMFAWPNGNCRIFVKLLLLLLLPNNQIYLPLYEITQATYSSSSSSISAITVVKWYHNRICAAYLPCHTKCVWLQEMDGRTFVTQ